VVLIIDNYDSFVHNLARYVRLLGHATRVVRNDRLRVDDIEAMEPSHIVVSPGPCSPAEAGLSCSIVQRWGSRVPLLGVCLGHQCIGAAYGAPVGRARVPAHGKSCEIVHTGEGIFAGIPSPMRVGLYHSLAIDRDRLPAGMKAVATTREGEIMAVRHRVHPVWGVQFHPESILTEHGSALLARFLELRRAA
jgi:para-aminobenzoate synthetase component II